MNNTPSSGGPPERLFPAERFASYVDFLRQQGHRIELVEAPPVETLYGLSIRLMVPLDWIYKTICFAYRDAGGTQRLVAIVVPATKIVNTRPVEQLLSTPSRLKLASPEFVMEQTGFVRRGIPPIGFDAQWCIDTSVFDHKFIIAGGGNNVNQYVKMDPSILRMDHPERHEGIFRL